MTTSLEREARTIDFHLTTRGSHASRGELRMSHATSHSSVNCQRPVSALRRVETKTQAEERIVVECRVRKEPPLDLVPRARSGCDSAR